MIAYRAMIVVPRYVILDGKLFDGDRLTETTLSVQGETIDARYSGKHRDFGANIQAVMRPDGLPIWTSAAMPGHLHDTNCARELGVTAALNWSAAELDLPALADSGYESAGHGIKTPIKQPTDGTLGISADSRCGGSSGVPCQGHDSVTGTLASPPMDVDRSQPANIVVGVRTSLRCCRQIQDQFTHMPLSTRAIATRRNTAIGWHRINGETNIARANRRSDDGNRTCRCRR
ncbi:transposase family protein [Actinoplanes sp. NEAU-A12]|uniref:Transposase family protein n=1 Tax=Actinoplanes sandaracinus TaxID=3045177 RepID=A0ABT6WNW3_9ACTN|nr:transposase family protein [Actinoplanes sandaracinus]MDI6101403.1 transposase family protein [Actinoplanes sandaracinus]